MPRTIDPSAQATHEAVSDQRAILWRIESQQFDLITLVQSPLNPDIPAGSTHSTTVLRLTDAPKPISFRGEIYQPAWDYSIASGDPRAKAGAGTPAPEQPMGGLSPGAERYEAGLAPNQTSLVGVLDSDLIRTEDLLAGRYRDAKIQRFEVSYGRATDPDTNIHRHDTFYIKKVSFDGETVSAEVEGLAGYMQVKTGDVFTRGCRETLGRGRCGGRRALRPIFTITGTPSATITFNESHGFETGLTRLITIENSPWPAVNKTWRATVNNPNTMIIPVAQTLASIWNAWDATVSGGGNPGNPYSVGDILTVSGGVFVTSAKFRVTRVTEFGGVEEVIRSDGGGYSVLPANPVATTTPGPQSGATLNVRFQVGSARLGVNLDQYEIENCTVSSGTPAVPTRDEFELLVPEFTVTGFTPPNRLTIPSHNLRDGIQARLKDVFTYTPLTEPDPNKNWTISVIDANTVALLGANYTSMDVATTVPEMFHLPITTGWFDFGHVVWLAGSANEGFSRMIRTSSAVSATRKITIGLDYPMPLDVSIGETCTIVTGCDHTKEAGCILKFQNVQNYGGQDEIPGQDATVQVPPGA